MERVKRGTDMTNKAPTSGQPNNSGEDFLTKHGISIVVVIFSILIGAPLPAIIQNGRDPDKLFTVIVLVTLPYTAAAVLIFLMWILVTSEGNLPFGGVMLLSALSGFILWGFLWLASIVHWGLSDAEADWLNRQIASSHIHPAYRVAFVVISFYVAKYGSRCSSPQLLLHLSLH